MPPQPPDNKLAAPHPPHLDPASPLAAAAASLAPALDLLERFHHRNRNQHRLSKWWAQADMLRRHVRKMLRELEDALARAERERERERRVKIEAKRERKRKRMGMGMRWGDGDGHDHDGGGGVNGGEEDRDTDGNGNGDGNEVVSKRAEYLRWKLGPGAYL